jgi:Uma2 family endonuclease
VNVFGIETACCQSAISASIGDPARNNPIPDVSVTKEQDAAYFGRFPGPDDLLFVGEVSDSSLAYDLNEKALLYGRASIPEYWVLDIAARRLFVHRNPCETGYAEVRAYIGDDEIATLQAPDLKEQVSNLLPPLVEFTVPPDSL